MTRWSLKPSSDRSFHVPNSLSCLPTSAQGVSSLENVACENSSWTVYVRAYSYLSQELAGHAEQTTWTTASAGTTAHLILQVHLHGHLGC